MTTEGTDSAPAVAPDAAREVLALQRMLLEAMRDRSTLTIRYHPKPGKTFSLRDLVKIERGLNGWISGTIRSLGGKVPRGWRLALPLAEIRHVDDDGDWIDVTLDFATIFAAPESVPSKVGG